MVKLKHSQLAQVQKTFAGSLISRARFGDEKSAEVVKRLQELQKETGFYGKPLGNHQFLQAKERTEILDAWVQKWIDANPEGRILNVGCGFCTRFWRLDTKSTHWTELDYPAMIEIRHIVLPIEDTMYQTYIGHDLSVPHNVPYDLLIGEGVFMHMPEAHARQHIKGECMFDVMGLGRSISMGHTMRWKWDPDKWNFQILDKIRYDVTMKNREAFALWVKA